MLNEIHLTFYKKIIFGNLGKYHLLFESNFVFVEQKLCRLYNF
jgi:hypothetical protein